MKRVFLILSMIGILALTACSAAPRSVLPSLEMPAGAPAAPPVSQESAASGSDFAKASTSNQPTTTDRLVIQIADLSIVVKDVHARVKAIEDMASSMGGFVVSANVYQTTARDGTPVPQAQVVVRVPQPRLDEALDQIKKDTVDVQNETRSGQDVTDQYVDLQSQLTAKEAAADQLLSIMKDAHKTEDVLAVYSQLQQIQSEIQVLKGQIKYTEQSAALSAVTVNIIAEETIKPLEVGGWKPQGVARDAIQSLIYFWQGFVDFMIRFVLLILPVLLTIAIPIYLVFLLLRWIFRKLRKPKAPAPAAKPKK